MSEDSEREAERPQSQPGEGEAPQASVDAVASAPAGEDMDAAPFDEVDVRDLLRRALDGEPKGDSGSVLANVQRRLRDESKGQYFADGWATAPTPRETYLITAAVMFALLVAAWFLLGPYGIHRVEAAVRAR